MHRPLGSLRLSSTDSETSARDLTHMTQRGIDRSLDAEALRLDLESKSRDLEAFERRTARLLRVTAALSQAQTVQQVAEVLSSHGRELFGATGSLVYLLSRDSASLELVSLGGVAVERARPYQTLPLSAALPLSDAVRSNEPRFLATRQAVLAAYPALHSVALDGAGLQCIVALPLSGSRALLGGLAFSYYQAPQLDDVQRDVFLTVAAQCGVAIERAQAFDSERLAHAAADAARAQLYDLFMQAPAAIAIARGPELRLELVNEPYQQLFGASLVGHTFAEASPQLIEHGVHEILSRVYATGLAFTSPEFTLRPDGARPSRVLDLVFQPTRDANGAIDGVATFAYDVTERVFTQRRMTALAEHLTRGEARLRALVDATAAIVWTADPNGQVVEPSPSWLEFTGQRLDEYLDGGFLNAIHPDDRTPTMEIWNAAVAAGKPYAAAYRLQRADGSYADTLARAMPVRATDGRITQYVGCNVDVSELRRAESAAREHAATLATVNQLGQMIAAELDIQKLVQAVTDAATSVTGAQFGAFFYNVFDDHGGSYMLYTISGVPREHFSKFPMPRNTAVFATTFTGEGIVRVDDITTDPRYGKNAPYRGMPEGHLPVRSYLAVPVISRSGEVIGGIFLGHAKPGMFTERAETLIAGVATQAAIAVDNARLYGDAQRLIKALEATNRELDQFAYVTSHDLRAPLRGIGSLAEWLEEDVGASLTGDARQKLELLRGRVRRMEGLIQGILEFSRAARVPGKREEVDIARLIAEICELLSPKPPAVVRVDRTAPVMSTERLGLQQVLMNLIGNGLKHAGREDATVDVSVQPVEIGWEFRIRDNGPGIEPRFRDRVWGIFQTLESRDTMENTGIGLAIVKKIVEARGGRAWIEGEPGDGATFAFTWPKQAT